MPARAGAALTTPERAGTARRFGSGNLDGEVYVRNQRYKAPQATHPLETGGSGPGARSPAAIMSAVGPPGRVKSPVPVAGRKVCGVLPDGGRGHSWAPIPLSASVVNVGTVLRPPVGPGSQPGGGQAHRETLRSQDCNVLPLRERTGSSRTRSAGALASRRQHDETTGSQQQATRRPRSPHRRSTGRARSPPRTSRDPPARQPSTLLAKKSDLGRHEPASVSGRLNGRKEGPGCSGRHSVRPA